jgi:hypothetical protein
MSEENPHVEVLEPGILFYREVRRMTPETVGAMEEQILGLIRGIERYALVLDLTRSARPDASAREALFRAGPRMVSRLAHLSAVVRGNVINQAMLQVFAHTVGVRSYSLHDALEEAVDAARRSLRHP